MARRRFLAEARALARVRHPSLVVVHEVIELDEICAFAMEWIGGESLADRLVREGSLDPSRVCRVGGSIARALAAAHDAGLLHRDVKPSNILLRESGEALLSDFGLVLDDAASALTGTGVFLGTMAYAAPEQLRGDRPSVGPATDVYSLGATLHHALTGAAPVRPVAPRRANPGGRDRTGSSPLFGPLVSRSRGRGQRVSRAGSSGPCSFGCGVGGRVRSDLGTPTDPVAAAEPLGAMLPCCPPATPPGRDRDRFGAWWSRSQPPGSHGGCGARRPRRSAWRAMFARLVWHCWNRGMSSGCWSGSGGSVARPRWIETRSDAHSPSTGRGWI